MKQRRILSIACLLWSSAVSAFQPVESGLQPLYERVAGINSELISLDGTLRADDTPASARASAYRRWKALVLERLELEQDVKRTQELARSPLVLFATPSTEPVVSRWPNPSIERTPSSWPLPAAAHAASSGQLQAAAHVKR